MALDYALSKTKLRQTFSLGYWGSHMILSQSKDGQPRIRLRDIKPLLELK